jgi:hypothetical protein
MIYFIGIAGALFFLVGLVLNWKARTHIVPKANPPRFMFFTGLKPFLDEVGYRQIKASLTSFSIGGIILGTSFLL